MNILEKLIADNFKNKSQFAKAVGVSPQRLNAQINNKNELLYAFKYACVLKLEKISGVANGREVTLKISYK